jgi:hypothetical protein
VLAAIDLGGCCAGRSDWDCGDRKAFSDDTQAIAN